MTLLKRVRNVLGWVAECERGRWWPVAVLALLVPPAVWLVSTAAVTSAEEKKPASEAKTVRGEKRAEPAAHPKYTATALLMVRFEPPTVAGVAPIAAQEWTRDRFEIYKATQQQLLGCRFVLSAALRKPAVAQLPAIRHSQRSGDPVRWLKSKLRVTFPGDAEIMEVSLTADDPNEAATLVQAVVDAYMQEAVNAEVDRKRLRLSELDRAVAEKEQDIRARREKLKKLATELGTSTTENLTLKQRLALEELSMYRQELRKLQGDLRLHERDLAVQKSMLQDAGKENAEMRQEIRRLETQVAVETKQAKDLEKQVQGMRREVERFGNSTVDMEMLLNDIKNADFVLNQLASERDRMRVECRSAARIMLLQPAHTPEVPDN